MGDVRRWKALRYRNAPPRHLGGYELDSSWRALLSDDSAVGRRKEQARNGALASWSACAAAPRSLGERRAIRSAVAAARKCNEECLNAGYQSEADALRPRSGSRAGVWATLPHVHPPQYCYGGRVVPTRLMARAAQPTLAGPHL
jgi:hypothetical protein